MALNLVLVNSTPMQRHLADIPPRVDTGRGRTLTGPDWGQFEPPRNRSRATHSGISHSRTQSPAASRTLVASTTSSKAAVPTSPLEDRSIDERLLQILERQIKTKPMAPLSFSSGKEYYAIVRPYSVMLTIACLSSHDGSGSFETDSPRNHAVAFFAWHDFTTSI